MARAYTNYGQGQGAPIPGREADMVPNNAGGYGFRLDDWERLERFLILGSEGGTYYVGEGQLTEQNATCAIRCIKSEGIRAVRMAYVININNRAPKTDQQLFVVALALKYGDEGAKKQAEVLLPEMLRIGTHLLHFCAMIDGLGGWGRRKRRIVSNWFNNRDADETAFQILKYRQRDGWAMKDVLRLAHPYPLTMAHDQVYCWAVDRPAHEAMPRPSLIDRYQTMQAYLGEGGEPSKAALMAIEGGLPREALPTEALADHDVWRALLPKTPIHALLRNLGRLTAQNFLAIGRTDDSLRQIVMKLTDQRALERNRVHPFAVLLARLVYERGAGLRGKLSWTPLPAIIGALDEAYDRCIQYQTPTGKRVCVAVDISGSMTDAKCIGTPVNCSAAALGMAYTVMKTEREAQLVHFDTSAHRVNLIPEMGLRGYLSHPAQGGGTNLAAPILWALGRAPEYSDYWNREGRVPVGDGQVKLFDAFLLLTDNETWLGSVHAAQALAEYRSSVNPEARMICAAMAANHASVIDPNDKLSLGIAGLDTNLPAIIREFIGGEPLRIGFDDGEEDE